MNNPGFILADIELENVSTSWHKMTAATHDSLQVFIALFVLIAVLVGWAALVRRRRRRKHHRHHHHHNQSSTIESTQSPSSESSNGVKRRKWRRRRRDHRPRNPTLAETGGLPPPRSDGPAKSSP